FGVHALESAADDAEQIAKAAVRNTKDIRSLEVLLQSDRDEAQRRLDAVRSELAGKQTELDSRSAEMTAVRQRRAALEEWRRFADASSSHVEALTGLAAEVSAILDGGSAELKGPAAEAPA